MKKWLSLWALFPTFLISFCTVRGANLELLGRGAILALFSQCDNVTNNLTDNATDVVQTKQQSLFLSLWGQLKKCTVFLIKTPIF